MIDQKIEELISRVTTKLKDSSVRQESSISGLKYSLIKPAENTEYRCFYEPAIDYVLQGGKDALVGDVSFEYKAGQSFVSAVDMPCSYKLTDSEKPYISISLVLDREIISTLIDRIGASFFDKSQKFAGSVDSINEEILDLLLKLTEIEEKGSVIDKAVLANALKYQLFYLMLSGSHGSHVFNFYHKDSIKKGILDSVIFLRARYKDNFDINKLAGDVANMQNSTFFKYFKESTGVSPLQFKKQLRLLEANKMIRDTDDSLSTIAFLSGYESISQFSREYKSMFGISPSKTNK